MKISDLAEDPFGVNPRRPARPGSRPARGHQVQEAPIDFDPSEPMNPMIHSAGANPAKLQDRMLRASSQLKDLAARAENASPLQWEMITKNFDELAMNIGQIKHGLEELAAQRKKGGTRSRGIDPTIG